MKQAGFGVKICDWALSNPRKASSSGFNTTRSLMLAGISTPSAEQLKKVSARLDDGVADTMKSSALGRS